MQWLQSADHNFYLIFQRNNFKKIIIRLHTKVNTLQSKSNVLEVISPLLKRWPSILTLVLFGFLSTCTASSQHFPSHRGVLHFIYTTGYRLTAALESETFGEFLGASRLFLVVTDTAFSVGCYYKMCLQRPQKCSQMLSFFPSGGDWPPPLLCNLLEDATYRSGSGSVLSRLLSGALVSTF